MQPEPTQVASTWFAIGVLAAVVAGLAFVVVASFDLHVASLRNRPNEEIQLLAIAAALRGDGDALAACARAYGGYPRAGAKRLGVAAAPTGGDLRRSVAYWEIHRSNDYLEDIALAAAAARFGGKGGAPCDK